MTLDRTQAPQTHIPTQFSLMEPQHIACSGADLYVVKGGQQPVLRIDFVFPAGNFYDTQGIVAGFTNDLLGEGTVQFSSKAVHEQLDRWGAYFQKEITRDYATVSLFCADEHVTRVLPLFFEIVYQSTFPDEEVRLHTENRKAAFISNQQKVEYICRNAFSGLVFGAHPYGNPIREAMFDTITPDVLRAFYQARYLSQKPFVFVVGQPSERAIEQVTEQLQRIQAPILADFTPVPFETYTPVQHHIEHAGALQTAIRVGCRTIQSKHPDFAALSFTNTLLGGYFGSRLMKNIREEKGYTYGIGSGLQPYKNQGVWVIATEVGTDVSEATLYEITHEITQLQTHAPGMQEMDTVRNYILGNFLKSIDGPFAQADRIRGALLMDLPNDYYQRYVQTMLTITPEKVQEMAKTYFDLAQLTTLTVG